MCPGQLPLAVYGAWFHNVLLTYPKAFRCFLFVGVPTVALHFLCGLELVEMALLVADGLLCHGLRGQAAGPGKFHYPVSRGVRSPSRVVRGTVWLAAFQIVRRRALRKPPASRPGRARIVGRGRWRGEASFWSRARAPKRQPKSRARALSAFPARTRFARAGP